jgi:regulator of replication initiation timing
MIPHAGADLVAENAHLRRENGRLRMEREILKKTLQIFSVADREAAELARQLVNAES